jgi:hypothetical protein
MGSEAGAHCCAPQSQRIEIGQTVFDSLQAVGELRDIARELLPSGEWCGVHQMGAPNLDNLFECLSLLRQRVP